MHVFLNVFYKLVDRMFSYHNHLNTFMAMWSLVKIVHETIPVTPM